MVGTCLLGKISAGSSEVRVSGAVIPQCSLVLDYQLDQKELGNPVLARQTMPKLPSTETSYTGRTRINEIS